MQASFRARARSARHARGRHFPPHLASPASRLFPITRQSAPNNSRCADYQLPIACPTPSPSFYSRHFSHRLRLSFLVLCSETARKSLLVQSDRISIQSHKQPINSQNKRFIMNNNLVSGEVLVLEKSIIKKEDLLQLKSYCAERN